MKKILRNSLIFISILALVIASAPFMSGSVALALDDEEEVTCDQAFYSNNDVLFYNPCATSCGDATNTGASKVDKLHGKNNGEKILNFWVDAGLTSQQAAGVTGSMQHESGFSAFRQETSKTWPAGGWGVAQFTGGQRDAATAYVKIEIGPDLFDQYYKNTYGGAVVESAGFIPSGITPDVNDKFLLAELNYLFDHIKKLIPSDYAARVNGIKSDYGQDVPKGMTLYDYLKKVVQAPDAAAAWTYLYEYPGNIKSTAAARMVSAADILELYSNGIQSTCGGGLQEGGMTLEQAVAFMKEYTDNPSNVQYIGGAGKDCAGGPLSNCVSFSVYFLNKYTNIKTTPAPGNGSTVVANIISKNPTLKNGHSPQPYAIFSTPSGSMYCGAVKCGHTGVILGVDVAAGKVVVGEAGCGAAAGWDTARLYPLSQFDSDAYTYAYLGDQLKADVK